MGTPAYMSPEQVRGQAIDHRTDIFSFGSSFYEMLTGTGAFRSESSVETMNAILKEAPPELSETNGNINPALSRIVRRCLEKNPEERFQSANDLVFALDVLSSSTKTSGQIEAIPLGLDRRKYFTGVIRQHWLFVLLALAVGGSVILMIIYSWSGKRGIAMGEGSNVSNRKSAFTWTRQECPRDSVTTNLEVGGCDDAVKSFSLNSNPNGNWA